MKARLFTIPILILSLLPTYSNNVIAQSQKLNESRIAVASVVTMDFENLTDLTVVTNQYANIGVSFEGATILSQGGSLNYLNFPPRSGVNVIYDDPNYGGTIAISFDPSKAGNVLKVGGYVTGNRNVTMTAFDSSGNVLGSDETGGANYDPVGMPNKLLEINSSVQIARVVFSDGGNTFTVDDFFFESQQSCQIPNVPLFKQTNETWASDLYGGTTTNPWKNDDDKDGSFDEDPKDGIDNDKDGRVDEDPVETIKKWGCALTSAAMIVSYHGSQQTGFTTTPRNLNNWLRANNGYSGGAIIWAKVAEYARSQGVQLYFYSGWGPDDGVVNWYLCNSWPIILGIRLLPPYDGHFVVATGQLDSKQWSINDPGFNSTQLSTNSYTSYRKYGSSPTDLSALSIIGHSPIEFLVTDPAGRRTGYDPQTGQYVQEILDSSYGIEAIGATDGTGGHIETLMFETGAPIAGTYSVQLIGIGTGEYQIDFVGYDSGGSSSQQTIIGAIADTARISLTLVYSSTPGSQITVTLPNNVAPIADAGGPYQVNQGQAFALDASQSIDPEGSPLAYRWDVNDDGLWEINWTDNPTVIYTFARAGDYTVRLEVSDGLAITSTTTSASVTAKVFLPLIVK